MSITTQHTLGYGKTTVLSIPCLQGSAADLIKLAMCAWDEWSGQQGHPAGPSPGHLGNLPQQPGANSPSNTAHAQLIAQIHGELRVVIQPNRAVLGTVQFIAPNIETAETPQL